MLKMTKRTVGRTVTRICFNNSLKLDNARLAIEFEFILSSSIRCAHIINMMQASMAMTNIMLYHHACMILLYPLRITMTKWPITITTLENYKRNAVLNPLSCGYYGKHNNGHKGKRLQYLSQTTRTKYNTYGVIIILHTSMVSQRWKLVRSYLQALCQICSIMDLSTGL